MAPSVAVCRRYAGAKRHTAPHMPPHNTYSYGLLGHTLYACVALGYNVHYPFCSTIIPLLLPITSYHINILM
ncbi:hypothetical protein HanXRQr2_Chr01g0005791 [Helianthus annuus]|uniref:Uncharacterized protein n=1 Tax=Helianthus annuus TaxID=4232 RepID=A0A9K3JT29_HELAN|nr:hypothetical protein HanXRQr2_Chr01g0005791 [Helianthus annuus]